MGRHSEIHDLEREIAECEEALCLLDDKEKIIRRLQAEISDEAEEPVNKYDMTVAGEFRGNIEADAEDMQHHIYIETHSAQERTSKLLDEIVQAKERIREHIEKCQRRIDQLWEEIEAESRSNAI